MAALGSLSASWALPASCSSQTGLYDLDTIIGDAIYDYKIRGPTDTAACMPPSYTAATTSAAYNYYYPASVCPSGYTTGCNPTATNTVIENSIVPLVAYTCCPTGAIAFSCFSGSPDYPWLSTLGCTTSMARTLTTTVTGVDVNGSTSISTSVGTPGPYAGWGAYAIVMLAPEATATSSSDSSASSASTISNSVATATPTSVSDSTDGSGSGSRSLSAGAWAGIGVGLGVAIAALAFLIFVACQRRARKQKEDMTPDSTIKPADHAETPLSHDYMPTELGGGNSQHKAGVYFDHPHSVVNEMGGDYPDQAYSGNSPAELIGDKRTGRHEADHTTTVFELSGAGR